MQKKLRATPRNVDEYLSALDGDTRIALEKLRTTIRSAAPGAEECISYGLPSFRLNGTHLVSYGAAKNHCAFYAGGALNEFLDELKDFDTAKGTIRFQPANPIPAALVRRLVKAQLARRTGPSAQRAQRSKSRAKR